MGTMLWGNYWLCVGKPPSAPPIHPKRPKPTLFKSLLPCITKVQEESLKKTVIYSNYNTVTE